MGFDCKITVFTPTYNRAYILEGLYRSLQRQTWTDFEWLVVDDGSRDGTEALFDRWQREDNPFPIRYVRQENGGKCRAINRGLTLARGELFFTVDSDDYLTDDALEKAVRWERELPRDQKFCGVAGNLGTAPDTTPNTPVPGEYFDGTAFDRYGKVDGERAMIFYTRIHRQYPYPEFPGEKFMTEAVAWNRMAGDGYKVRYFNDIIWIYEYKDDGLTRSGYRAVLPGEGEVLSLPTEDHAGHVVRLCLRRHGPLHRRSDRPVHRHAPRPGGAYEMGPPADPTDTENEETKWLILLKIPTTPTSPPSTGFWT